MSNNKPPRTVKLSLSCTFGTTENTPRSGTITTLSTNGCFVKTRAIATKGNVMYFKLWLPEEGWLPLSGTVGYHMEGVGFKMVFAELTPEQQAILERLIEQSPVSGTP